jgi:hypothetical protein
MPNATASQAPLSSHHFHKPVAPCFSNAVGRENMRIQCQLPEIFEVFLRSEVFLRRVFASIMIALPLRDSATPREIYVFGLPRVGRSDGFTRRREDAKTGEVANAER